MAAEMKGDPCFRALLDEIWDLHCLKNADYGDSADNFANYNRAKRFGVPGKIGGVKIRFNGELVEP